jgi:hypothetical protein
MDGHHGQWNLLASTWTLLPWYKDDGLSTVVAKLVRFGQIADFRSAFPHDETARMPCSCGGQAHDARMGRGLCQNRYQGGALAVIMHLHE